MSRSREEICGSASRKLMLAAADLGKTRALVGLDGFVDNIIAVVDKRYADGRFDPVRTIASFGEKIRAAAGESSNYELVVRQSKLGGNGPIMADALACIGLGVTYLGSLGYPEMNPVFREFAARAEVISFAASGVTDALEFDDGKIMLGKYETLHEVNWDNLVARVGFDKLHALVRDARLIGLVNWTMLTGMNGIWQKLLDDVLPSLDASPRTLFLDLADPEKRSPMELRGALGLLGRFQSRIDVILGLNLKEAMQVAAVLSVTIHGDPEAMIGDMAAAIRESLGVGCVVIHPRRGAAAATAHEIARFAGPFVQHPKISTGAGDHFNAGFCLGRILGLDLEESLCAGVSTSGYYVRSAKSPTLADLSAFAAELPPAER